MLEKRRMERRHLIYYLRIFEQNSRRLLGHVVDITHEGLMMMSEKKIMTNKTFELRMKLPEELLGKQDLKFTAESKWSKVDVNPDFFVTGFQIHGLVSSDIEVINHLIENYGFKS